MYIYIHICMYVYIVLPSWYSGKESVCQCWKHTRHGFDPSVGNPFSICMPLGIHGFQNKKWQPTLAFLPKKFHGQRSLHRIGHI